MMKRVVKCVHVIAVNGQTCVLLCLTLALAQVRPDFLAANLETIASLHMPTRQH